MCIWYLCNIYSFIVVNRVRFVEELLNELMNVFVYYKTLTIHLDNIVAIIF